MPVFVFVFGSLGGCFSLRERAAPRFGMRGVSSACVSSVRDCVSPSDDAQSPVVVGVPAWDSVESPGKLILVLTARRFAALGVSQTSGPANKDWDCDWPSGAVLLH